MSIVDPIIVAALIAGFFGVIVSIISFVLFLFQSRATNRLERDLKQYETKLHTRKEVHLRLYEKTMDEILRYNSLLRDVHLRLCDYKNGVRDAGLNREIEGKNTFLFYESWNKLRFPGVYVPTDIAKELDAIRQKYETLKSEIYEVGKDPSRTNRVTKLAKYDQTIEEMEIKSNNLIDNWKSSLLNKENIFEVILGNKD